MTRFLPYLTIGLIAFISLVVALKLADMFVSATYPDVVYDNQTADRTIRSYNLYPYTGFHLQPDFHHEGPMPWGEFYDSFDYQSGDHGFFVDFDLENPPLKSEQEYRIVLIGGSGAQGWGAQSNEHMLYSVLERQLNERLAQSGLKVRVINLAMGGSVSYQNFVALNRWAHPLEPDLILSYSGANDITVFEGNRSNIYNDNFLDLRLLMGTNFFSESPDGLKTLAEWFPGLVKKTNLGALLRYNSIQSDMPTAREKERQFYNKSFGLEYLPTMYASPIESSVIVDKIAIPEFVHALKSIRRDFPEIPVMVARQVMDWRRVSQSLPMEEDYNKFWRESVGQLQDYGDAPWYFVDLQRHWEESGYFGPEYREGFVHLDNDKVLLAANHLVPQIESIILNTKRNEKVEND